jgi:iron complex transport system substrate-binding protein
MSVRPRSPGRRAARAALALALACASACGGRGEGREAGGSATARRVQDPTGAVVVLPADVRRIVTTVPGQTATLLELGLGTALVGVSDQDPKEGVLGTLPRLSAYPSISAEAVAALDPDLLLVDRTLSSRDLEPLRRRFPGTFATDSRTLDGLRETFLRLGEAVGRDVRARRLADELDLARREAKAPGRPRVLLLSDADPQPYALGPGALLDDMLRSVGGENVAWDLGRPSGQISSELVRERAPDWILLTGATFGPALRKAWASVPAVASGRVVDVGRDEYVQAGPGTAKALRRLAAILSGGPR